MTDKKERENGYEERSMEFKIGVSTVEEALEAVDDAVIQFQKQRPEFDPEDYRVPDKTLSRSKFEDLLVADRAGTRKVGFRYGEFWVELDSEGTVTVRFWEDRKKHGRNP